MLDIPTLAAVGGAQFGLAVAAVLVVYRAREHHWVTGIVVGVFLAAGIVTGEYIFGRLYFTVTWWEVVDLVLVSAAAGIAGVAVASTIFEPEINSLGGSDRPDLDELEELFEKPDASDSGDRPKIEV